MPRVWFITGASAGFGRCVTEAVLKSGDIAVATLRTPSAVDDLSALYGADKLLVVKCDVSKPTDITAAFAKATATFGRVDVVFNNAATVLMAEIEGSPDDFVRGLFEVNFWGLANVSREAVRVFREVNAPGVGGRLLNVGSIAGYRATPALGYYSASKFAVEGFTEALAKEVDPAWSIKISIIEPGAFSTRGATALTKLPVHPAYTDPKLPTQHIRTWFDGFVDGLGIDGDPIRAAARILEFAELPTPPMRWPMGKDAVASVRQKIKDVTAEVDAYEGLSEGLTFET